MGRTIKYILVFHTFQGLRRVSGPFCWKLYLVSWHPGTLLRRQLTVWLPLSRVIEVRAGMDLGNQVKLPFFMDDETGWRRCSNAEVTWQTRTQDSSFLGEINPSAEFLITVIIVLYWSISQWLDFCHPGHKRLCPDMTECQRKFWPIVPTCVLWSFGDPWIIERDLQNHLCPPILPLWLLYL